MYKTGFFYFFLMAILGLVATSCYKKDFDNLKLANATPEYLYPLLDAELSMKDIVDPNKKQLYITEDIEGFYTFIYYQDLIEKSITDFLKISDVSLEQSVVLTSGEVSSLPTAGSVTHSFSNSFTLATTNDEKLKNIVVKSGSLPIAISSTFKHNIEVVVTFPYIKKNGVALTTNINLNYSGTVPTNVNSEIDLSGYTIDCSENNTKVNSLSYIGTMKVLYTKNNPINTTQKIDLSTGISNIVYSYVDGYIGQYVIDIPKDSVGIDIFDNAYLGSIYFTDPKVRTIITNSIGAESTVKINSLLTQSTITGNTPITGTPINTAISILYPSLAEVGQSKSTTIQLDRDNSNVLTVFNPAPNKVIYDMSGMINPLGESMNFVTDNSSIKIRGEVEIPMEGKISEFVLLDTIENIEFPDLSVSGKSVTVLRAGFNVALSNGFPVNINIQMYFLDDLNNKVDSLFKSPHLITSAAVNSEGKVTIPTDVLIHEVFGEARYDRVTHSSKAIIYAYFSTVNNGTIPVKIYSSYKIKSNISIDVKANVTF